MLFPCLSVSKISFKRLWWYLENNLFSWINPKSEECCNILKLKEMEMGLKIVSRRDYKNIDSTENVKRGKKIITSEKVRKGRHFFQIYHMRGSNSFHYLRGVKNDFCRVILNSSTPLLLGYKWPTLYWLVVNFSRSRYDRLMKSWISIVV